MEIQEVCAGLEKTNLDRKETDFCHAKAKPKIGFHRILTSKAHRKR
jgi:hypothetical protein